MNSWKQLSQKHRGARWVRRLAILGLCAMASGCNCWNFRGEGFEQSRFPEAPAFRPAGDEAGGIGVSSKAREIERNLGYSSP